MFNQNSRYVAACSDDIIWKSVGRRLHEGLWVLYRSALRQAACAR